MLPKKCTDCRYHLLLDKDSIEEIKANYRWSHQTRRAFNIYMQHGSLREILFCTQLGVIDSIHTSTYCKEFQQEIGK